MEYRITELLNEVFGLSPAYSIKSSDKSPVKLSYSGIEELPNYVGPGEDDNYWNDSKVMSHLGTPIVFNTILSPNSICKKYNDLGELIDVKLAPFSMPPATMYSFRRAKNITKTNILGSNGTVKEIYGFDDWIIDVKGICIDTPDFSAKNQLNSLLEYSEVASSIGISGVLFNLLNINSVVIEDFAFNVLQGSNGGSISFTMQLSSDEPIEIQITKPNHQKPIKHY